MARSDKKPNEGAPPAVQQPTANELAAAEKLDHALENINRLQRQLDEQAKQSRALVSTLTPPSVPELLQTVSFGVPAGVKGYTQVDLIRGFADATCPPNQVLSGETLTIWFKITDVSILERATPLYVRIIEERKPKDFWHAFGQWYEMRPDRNKVEISKPLTPGKYELRYGVYIRAEMDKEYPPFRSKSCQLTVIAKP